MSREGHSFVGYDAGETCVPDSIREHPETLVIVVILGHGKGIVDQQNRRPGREFVYVLVESEKAGREIVTSIDHSLLRDVGLSMANGGADLLRVQMNTDQSQIGYRAFPAYDLPGDACELAICGDEPLLSSRIKVRSCPERSD